MTIRITHQTAITEAISSTAKINSRLADLQRQASSGLRIERPSDSPEEIGQLIRQKVRNSRLESSQQNIRTSSSNLNESVSRLLEVNSSLVRAKQIAIEAPQSSERQILAREIDVILEGVVRQANSSNDNGFFFSGAAVDQEPFETVRDAAGRIVSVEYRGSDEVTLVSVGDAGSVEVNSAGSDVFELSERRSTIYTGRTGAQSGAGTDSGVGITVLQVRHTATTYDGTSGISPGTSSVDGDTVLGLAGTHTLTIEDTSGTGSSGTVSLNGGDPVAFTSLDSDLQVTGADGVLVYVDTSTISAGFSGTVDIAATGTISVDEGASAIAIDFSSNQQVIDGQSGNVTNVDTSAVRSAGDEQLEYDGTAGVFDALIQLRDSLLNENEVSESELGEILSRRLGDIDRARSDVLEGVSRQSIQLENLQAIEAHTEEQLLQTRQRIAEIETADIAEIVLGMQSEQNLLQLTYASAVRVLDQSILDFLR
ncbi:MAG: flagellar hook-associated protein FlgL [Planctomycetaceae bacterium]